MRTGDPRYSRTFYLRNRFFTLEKMVRNDSFPVKKGLFTCVSTANNEGNLYVSEQQPQVYANFKYESILACITFNTSSKKLNSLHEKNDQKIKKIVKVNYFSSKI